VWAVNCRGEVVNDKPDRGAVIVWVALMIVALVGIGALVIDVGALYAERRELQNGADAAALAVAQECAEGDCGDKAAVAQQFANLNAKDGVSAVDPATPCGSGPGLATCDPGVNIDPAARGWVRVGTTTETEDGGDEVSFLLAPLIGAFTGQTVSASAVAAWGVMGGGAVVPLVFSQCEWEALGGNSFTEDLPSGTKAITFHGTNPSSVGCPIGPSGLDLPGGFGRVIADKCKKELVVGQWADVDPGADLAAGCDVRSWQNQVVTVAVFDETNGKTGANGKYRIAGFVGLKIVGYEIVAAKGGGGRQRFGSCTPERPSDQYLCGEFVPVSQSGSQFGTGTFFGAQVVKMAG
jgi:hypothetical protein